MLMMDVVAVVVDDGDDDGDGDDGDDDGDDGDDAKKRGGILGSPQPTLSLPILPADLNGSSHRFVLTHSIFSAVLFESQRVLIFGFAGSIWFQLPQDSLYVNNIMGVLFMSTALLAFISFSSVPIYVEQRSIFNRQAYLFILPAFVCWWSHASLWFPRYSSKGSEQLGCIILSLISCQKL